MRFGAVLIVLAGCVPTGGFDAGQPMTAIDASTPSDAGPADAGVVMSGWLMQVYAGTGLPGAADGPGATAEFNGPTALTLDAQGNVYVADTGNRVVRKIDPQQVVTTLGSSSALVDPRGLAVDGRGNVYVSDTQEQCVKVIDSRNQVRTFSGTCAMGQLGFHTCYDSGPGTFGPGDIAAPMGLAADLDSGVIYVADAEHMLVRFASLTSRLLGTVAGRQDTMSLRDGACGRGFCCGTSVAFPQCPAQGALFRNPAALALGPNGALYVAEKGNCTIRKIDTPAGTACQVTTLFGTSCDQGSPALTLNGPLGLAVDGDGLIYVADTFAQRVVQLDPSLPLQARLSEVSKPGEVGLPQGIAVESTGRVFVADAAKHRVVVFLPP